MSGARRRPRARHRLVREGETARRAGGVLAAATALVGTAVILYSMLPAEGSPGAGRDEGIESRTPEDADPSIAAFTRTNAPDETTEVGQERSGDSSDTVLLQVRKVLAPTGRTAPTGREWFGIRARTCMNDGAARSGELRWSGWAVVTDTNRSYAGRAAPWTDFPDQQYGSPGLDGGACQVGWILVSVPRGTFRHVVEVDYRPGNPDGLTWQV